MCRVAEIVTLKLHGVRDRGVPNLERVVLRAWEFTPVDLGRFFLTLGWQSPDGAGAVPFDTFLWLGETQIQPNQWLFVYTGLGTTRTSTTKGGENLYVLH